MPGLEITKFLSHFEIKSKKGVKIQIAVKIEMIYGMFLENRAKELIFNEVLGF